MSNKGVRLPKPKKQEQKAKKMQPSRSLLKLGIGAFSGGLALIGGIAAVAAFLPRVTVMTTDPVDSNFPFSSTVTVTNTGLLPLNNVGYAVAIRNIPYKNVGTAGDENYGSLIIPDSGKGRYLGLDDKYSFPFNNVIDGDKEDLVSADFAILIHYEVPVIHWQRQKLFPINVTRTEDGNFHWYAEPEPKHYTVTDHGYRFSKTLQLSRKRK